MGEEAGLQVVWMGLITLGLARGGILGLVLVAHAEARTRRALIPPPKS